MKIEELRLTPEEIKPFKTRLYNPKRCELRLNDTERYYSEFDMLQGICAAQLKKIVEWGDEACMEHFKDEPGFKRCCPLCWKQLTEKVEGKAKPDRKVYTPPQR
jgi:hypothetical protein